jgi:glucose-1-phosphatase
MQRVAFVVFDMDDVLVNLDRLLRLDVLEEYTGIAADDIDRSIWQSDFESAAEAGAYETGDAYLAEVNRRLGTTLTRDQWARARRLAMTPDHDVLGIAERIAVDHRIALLTNNGALVQEMLSDISPEVSTLFGDHAHTTSTFGARKPDRAVFERLLAHHGVEAGESLFIDDSPASVAAARRVGMNGIVYRDPEQLQTELGTYGVTC